jgi:hypothetical protein
MAAGLTLLHEKVTSIVSLAGIAALETDFCGEAGR